MIYLDYSANTPADPAVLEAFCQAERMFIGNPNSTHLAGQAAQAEMARVPAALRKTAPSVTMAAADPNGRRSRPCSAA